MANPDKKMIAATAIIKEGAKIGENVEIGDFCVIGENVEIGDGSKLYNNVTIIGNTKLGQNNTIFPYAVLGTIPQDLKYDGEEVELIIGDKNLIREHCMINPGTKGGLSKTIIGNENLLMAFVHVAHDCIIKNHCILANNATLGGHVEMGDYVNIGGMTPVHQFVHIGDGAMIAGGSALTQDIPPFCMAEGNRAVIRGLNKHRMRKLFSREDIDFISKLYKRIFSGSAPMRELVQKELDENPQNQYVSKICNFILQSQRGIPIKKGVLDE
ncbi:acyl-ACP--UDP-N-acetylglucosamine O-acyltransferase [Helicobacter cappadocius]|uniref:Acyl-[acyl-carrier-protein]--UDP-N-acetylglucosamine O-acyltransferase n=1 Tax=Helicobacter cappadocius TaxID=3063998 RepID=A0AA90T4J3_9HELI|nr:MULTISPECIES: acyl-ACP--UDP-N-acetylglucosamine O-acyltransferase [unclassified Helicobacter]MDO7252506.1 acyl-ACP--UDP-N-acetylglucosamine O-acyltransferase [Helicobacter sp. faydin-H75]MDP2538373.1 acyl-ACP--UDP-N-acetylglucosamine O-acyltransferase [Helicobacter sp. faydin-H76]